MCNINIRSLNDEKIEALKLEIFPYYDIICLTETNLPYSNPKCLDIDGFQTIFRKDRIGKRYGGIAVFVSECLSVWRCNDFEFNDLEALWLRVQTKNHIFLLCTCYRPPDASRDFWVTLQDSLDIAKQTNFNNIIITGDLNADPNTPNGIQLHNFCEGNHLTIHVTEPTRLTPVSATILDQFLSNMSDQIVNTAILDPISSCDHCPITLTLTFKIVKCKSYTRLVWNYDEVDLAELHHRLDDADWNECFVGNNIDVCAERWTTTFMNIARECIPNRIATIRPHSKPFFSNSLHRLARKKNRIHRQAKIYNTQYFWEKFREIRNE